MKVEINGQCYLVWWRYTIEPIRDIPEGQLTYKTDILQQVTTCTILELGPASLVLPPLLREMVNQTAASVRRWHKDPYSRERGRKESLTKILHNLFPSDRGSRRIFWAVYLHRKDAARMAETASRAKSKQVGS